MYKKFLMLAALLLSTAGSMFGWGKLYVENTGSEEFEVACDNGDETKGWFVVKPGERSKVYTGDRREALYLVFKQGDVFLLGVSNSKRAVWVNPFVDEFKHRKKDKGTPTCQDRFVLEAVRSYRQPMDPETETISSHRPSGHLEFTLQVDADSTLSTLPAKFLLLEPNEIKDDIRSEIEHNIEQGYFTAEEVRRGGINYKNYNSAFEAELKELGIPVNKGMDAILSGQVVPEFDDLRSLGYPTIPWHRNPEAFNQVVASWYEKYGEPSVGLKTIRNGVETEVDHQLADMITNNFIGPYFTDPDPKVWGRVNYLRYAPTEDYFALREVYKTSRAKRDYEKLVKETIRVYQKHGYMDSE